MAASQSTRPGRPGNPVADILHELRLGAVEAELDRWR
jgi:hypothetical protein